MRRKCPRCGGKIYRAADVCLSCGLSCVPAARGGLRKTLAVTLFVLAAVAAAVLLLYALGGR